MPNVDKQKKEKKIHPKSRKASQLSRTVHHQDRVQKQKGVLSDKRKVLRDKLLWFKSQLEDGKERYSLVEVSQLIASYISRFEDRLTAIEEENELSKKLGRRGEAHSAEYNSLKLVRERETTLFADGGFEAPDITNKKTLELLRNWKGDVKDLPKIKMNTFKNNLPSDTQKESDDTII